jgi:neopullulanase
VQFGIDGWRLDVPYEIDDDSFWQEFRNRVRAANPDTYIVGEIWHESQRWLSGDQFDAVMNYIQTRACIAFFGATSLAPLDPGGGYARLKPMMAQDFAREIERMLSLYHWEITGAQFNLLSSHDTPRFLTMVDDNKSALKLAMLFQMTMPGAPTIYYGDEVGLTGGYDPGSRGGMPWDRALWDVDLLDYVRGTVHLRKQHPALRRGTYRTVLAEGDTYAFERAYMDDRLIVAFNTSETEQTLHIPLESAPSQLHVRFDQTQAALDGSTLTIQAAPRSGTVIALDS